MDTSLIFICSQVNGPPGGSESCRECEEKLALCLSREDLQHQQAGLKPGGAEPGPLHIYLRVGESARPLCPHSSPILGQEVADVLPVSVQQKEPEVVLL